MAYQLIALDLDGTLLTTQKDILPETAADIELAAARGKTVIYCTGRCIPELEEYRLPAVRYAVASSGALIYDFAEERALFLTGIDPDCAETILAQANLCDAMAIFHTMDRVVVRQDQLARIAGYGIGLYRNFLREKAKQVHDMAAEARLHAFIPKINLFFHTEEDRRRTYEALKSLPLSTAFAAGMALELSPGGVTKAAGLRFLAEHLGVSMAETIAVGDSDNDRHALEAAGLAVVMGNGEAAVKALADEIVSDNDHNGVGEAITRFLLEESVRN